MISHKHKCVFIHIPKCAGMSIEHLLGINVKRFHRKFPWSVKHGLPKLAPYGRYFRAKNNYFKFTIVRNPWERAVSAFYWDATMNKTNPKPFRKKAALFIEKFGDDAFKNFVKLSDIKDKCTKPTHWRRQKPYLKVDYDFVGRVETLNKDIDYICQRLDLDVSNFKHINKSKKPKKHYSHFYDEESMDIIYNIYKDDINLLNYNFTNEKY